MNVTESLDNDTAGDSCPVVIETRGLTRYFGGKCAVDTVSFRVPRGSVFAFIGRNGAGKTTTIRMILGLLEPTRGTSTILGYPSLTLSPEARARIGSGDANRQEHHRRTGRRLAPNGPRPAVR